MYAYEGLHRLVDAMLALVRGRADLKLLLVGGGEADASLRQRVPEDVRDRMVFAGRIEHGEVPRYYSVMDIMVYPRIRSRLTELTAPLKVLEAMAMERLIVCSDVGGMRELVSHGVTGFLVEPGDALALAACISRLAGRAEERHAMGRRAREFVVRSRDWERIVARNLNVYQQLLVERAARTT